MIKKILFVCLSGTMLTGCIGTNAVTAAVRKGNLSVVKNRWGREGVFLGLNIFWVYRVCAAADLLIFNSIEFWSGENVVNGKSALANMPMDQVHEIFGDDVHMAEVDRLNDTEARMSLGFENGDRVTFDVTRIDEDYCVSYLGQEFYRGTLQQFAAQ